MKEFINDYWEKEALPTLIEFGEIPNVSHAYAATWKEDGHMDKAARLLFEWAQSRSLGQRVEYIELSEKPPLIYIEIPGEKDETVLFYGHLDKQPPMDGWSEGRGPWSPVQEGDLLYGRGLADDGYSIFAALGAVEAAQKQGKPLPRVVVIIEAGEESGSPDLPQYLEHLRDKIGSPNVVITLDSEGRGPDHLWLTESLRGISAGFLTIKTLKIPMHSGLATGVAPSAFRIARELLCRIEDQQTGKITNPVLNPPIPKEAEEKYAQLASVVGDEYIESYDLPKNLKTVGESLKENIERNLWEAGLEVTGFNGLPPHTEAGSVMHNEITLKLSFRIPPTVDYKDAAKEIKKLLETNPPYGAAVTYTPMEGENGWYSRLLSNDIKEAMEKAAQSVYGSAPVETGLGGAIPFISMMEGAYPDADHLVVGVLSPSSNAHGPDENMHIPTVKKLTHWAAEFLIQI